MELVYGQKSPLNAIQDIGEKKLEAAAKAKLNIKEDFVIEIMNLKHKGFEELMFHYLSYYQFNNKFQLLLSKQQLFWSIQKVLNKPVDEVEDETQMEKKLDSRHKITNTAQELINEIEYLKSEIYGTDDVKKVVEMHLRKVITPEMRLKQPA